MSDRDTHATIEKMDDLDARVSSQASDRDQDQVTKRLLSAYGSEDDGWTESSPLPRTTRPRDTYFLAAILSLCCILNIFQAVWLIGDSIRFFSARAQAKGQNSSIYHPSVRTVHRPLYPPESYEFTLTSHVIDKQIGAFDTDKGVVALPKDQPNVLRSKEFPWNSNKEVYVLSSYHSLHSLKLLWSELHKLTGDQSLSTRVLHSLNVLWEDTLCAARTDPMTISEELVANRTAINEAGQTRQCRDWSEVERFRVQNSACFKGMGGARKQKHMIEEWQNCPKGSPYQELVDSYIASARTGRLSAMY
ncbi:hypothetical protein EJ03DRAFT_332572 [Teratosphaeria nubilosa]|uniref:Uncharacterized protein n=1 Tax=Teratosphaeria nubilosa TaxID=161662 RepID=A0A6G1KTZ3_9PEZI|nr:hypothetical protein EJ03DRAFT_332572 [Teratosphaeria nubilosa]